MSIDRVSVVTSTAPVVVADYQAIIAQLEARLDAFSGREIVDGSTIRAGTIISIGGVAYKATTDTAITGTPSAYVKITPSGATASAEFVASLTGVTWSHAYGGYYDGSRNLHVFDEALSYAAGTVASLRTTSGVVSFANYKKGGVILTGSGNWVCPTGVFSVRVTIGGGGGGGGGGGDYTGGAGNGAGAGGGGSGGLTIDTVDVVPGQTYAYVNGAGGAGGGVEVNGSHGSDSTFLGLVGNKGLGGGHGVGMNPGTPGAGAVAGAGDGYFPVAGNNGANGSGSTGGLGGVANVHGMAKIAVVGAGSGGKGGNGDIAGVAGVASPGILVEW